MSRRLLAALVLSVRDVLLMMVTALALSPGFAVLDTQPGWPVSLAAWAGAAVLLVVCAYVAGLALAPLDRALLGWSSGESMPSPRDPSDTWRQRWASEGSARESLYALSLLTIILVLRLSAVMLLITGATLLAITATVRPLDWTLGTHMFTGPGAVAAAVAAGAVLTALGVALLVALVVAQERWARALLTNWPETERRRAQRIARSRARLVRGFDHERRRIERDLHDGAQQHLLAVGISLGLALDALDADHPARADAARAQRQLHDATDDLRRLIRGIHPLVLDDHGLPAALGTLADASSIPVQLKAELPHRPASHLESTVYLVASELLTNAQRHSGAQSITMELRHSRCGTGPALALTVVDDGHGGARARAGGGLEGLHDRIDSLGGDLRVDSPTGGPTRIELTLPWQNEEPHDA